MRAPWEGGSEARTRSILGAREGACKGPPRLAGVGRQGPDPVVQGTPGAVRPALASEAIPVRTGPVTKPAVFPDRGHSMGADSGWAEIARTALQFLSRHGVGVPAPAAEN